MRVGRRQVLQLAGIGAMSAKRRPRRHTYAQAITARGVAMARLALAAHFNPTTGGTGGLAAAAGAALAPGKTVGAQPGRAAGTGTALNATGGSAGSITHGSQIDSTNTGHRAFFSSTFGRLLVDGDLTSGGTGTTANNQVIEGKVMASGFSVDHTGVTIRGCWVQGELQNNSTGLVLQYVEIGPRTGSGNGTRGIGLSWDSFTATRCDVHNFSDGIRLNGTSSLTECYVHDLFFVTGDHNDCVQITGACTNSSIVRCKLWNPQGQSACIQTGSEQGVTSGLLYDSNYIKADGGAYCIAMGNTLDSGTHLEKVWNNIFDAANPAQNDLGERPFEYWILNNTNAGGGVAIPDARVGM